MEKCTTADFIYNSPQTRTLEEKGLYKNNTTFYPSYLLCQFYGENKCCIKNVSFPLSLINVQFP